MALNAHAVGVINQRVARDARGFMIGARKAAVDHNQFASCLNRIFTRRSVHRRVTVDDVREVGL